MDAGVALMCAAAAGALLLTALCAALSLRVCSLCFPTAEPEVRTVLKDPSSSWMIASYPTQVVAAYPDPWDQRSPDVVLYRTWS